MAVEPLVRRRKETWYFFSTCLHPWGSPLVQSSQLPVVKSFGDLARHPSTYQYLIQECKILHGFSEIVVLQGIIAVTVWGRFSGCFGSRKPSSTFKSFHVPLSDRMSATLAALNTRLLQASHQSHIDLSATQDDADVLLPDDARSLVASGSSFLKA